MTLTGQKLDAGFFTASPVECARALLGTEFSWHGCSGVIVETEAYAAEGDEACHTAFRPSARSFVEKHPAGTAYVYLNYGVHWLFNILVKGTEGAGFVLLRALEPTEGLETMRVRRGRSRRSELCSGPGKLSQSLGITGAAHGNPFLGDQGAGVRTRTDAREILSGPRIGISRETDRAWRFGLASECLSDGFSSR